MRKYVIGAIASIAVAGSASAAPVPSIQYTQGVYTLPPSANASIFEEFENGVTGTQYNAATQTSGARPESTTGNVLTLQGNVPGDGFTPDPDNNKYLAVQAGGTFTVGLGAGVSVFSFVFGTLDTYNTLRLFFSDSTSQLFTGAEIIGLANSQTNPSTYAGATGRVTYNAAGGSQITSAQFASTGFDAFEIDAIAAGVPEPGTWAMMLLGFGVAGGVMRRRKSKVTTRVAFA